MEKLISLVVNMWPTWKPMIIGKADVQSLYTIFKKIEVIEELIEIMDRTINIERFNETIVEFIKQVKCVTVSINGLELIHKICSEIMLWLHGAHVEISEFMRCNMNQEVYDEEYHRTNGGIELKKLVDNIIQEVEEEVKEKIMNKINDQQGGDSSKNADHGDKISCDQQNQAMVVDNQDKNKFNVVMNNHNNQNDKINCNQQNKLNFVDNICENKSVDNVCKNKDKIIVIHENHNSHSDIIICDQQNPAQIVDNKNKLINVVNNIHNEYTEKTNNYHGNELNIVHKNHNNCVDKINNCHQVICDNNMCKNNSNNNNLNVSEKKIHFKVMNNNIEKINTGQQYKIDCAKNKHKNKIKSKLVNTKMINDDKIKCKIKLNCLHLINDNDRHFNKSKHDVDGKFGGRKKYYGQWDMCDIYVLDCQLSNGDGKSSWLLSFASCQGPGDMITTVLVCELQWRIQYMPCEDQIILWWMLLLQYAGNIQ